MYYPIRELTAFIFFPIPVIDVIVHKRIRLLFDSDTIGFSLNLLSSPTFSSRTVYHASGVMVRLKNAEKSPMSRL